MQSLVNHHRDAAPRVSLVCFPYAGGGANVYRPWSELLPPDVALWTARLPGREERLTEPAYEQMEAIVNAFARPIAQSIQGGIL